MAQPSSIHLSSHPDHKPHNAYSGGGPRPLLSDTNRNGGILRRCCCCSSSRSRGRADPRHGSSGCCINCQNPRRDRDTPPHNTLRRVSTNIDLPPRPLRLSRHRLLRPRGMNLARRCRGTRELAAPLLDISICGAAHDHVAGAGGDGLREGAVDDAGGDDVVGEVRDGGAGEGVGCQVWGLGVGGLVRGWGGGKVGHLRR